jgi:hypothetical protein
MDGKERTSALELRAMATNVVKASGKWIETDMPGRNVLAFEDRDLQIVYREPWTSQKIEHYALDIFVSEDKVYSVRWKQGDKDIGIDLYKHGTWEARIKNFTSDMRIRPIK